MLLALTNSAGAQLIAIDPPFATADDNNVVITYDASQGNAGVLGESTIYAHTGVITSSSTGNTDWKYVIAPWTTNLPKALLTRVGNTSQYTLNIGNIRTYYNVPPNETILKLAFVFRTSNGNKTGKTASNEDIFVDISQGAFAVQITTPSTGQFVNASDNINIQAQASAAASLKLFANGVQVAVQPNGTALSHSALVSSLGTGRINLVLEGDKNGVKSYDSSYVVVRSAPAVAAAPSGIVDGINYFNDSTVTLQLFAPYKNGVYVVGDFNNWEYDPAYQMKRTPDGNRYWLTISGLKKRVEYGFQYSIDENALRLADVYAEKYLDPWNDKWISNTTYPNLKPYPTGKTTDFVSVLEIGSEAYQWKYTNGYQKPSNDKLIIYEVLLRDFIGAHDFKTLKDTISYFKRLGINCVQLMPIMEFEGNESWGYNPAFFFALDKYYGPKNTLKEFIDECHRHGIAVVLDIALNHSFGSNPQVKMYFNPNAGQYGQPTAQNPWFNQTDRHPFGVGYDYNHEAQPTKDFTDRVIKFWLTEYKIDGYRFDLSKGFTQKNTGGDVGAWSAYDQSRVDIWKRIRSQIITYAPEAYLILEHLGDNSEEVVLANEGFMLWGKMTENYAEATMGYNNSKQSLSWGNYKMRGFTYPNLITYAESHDEERIMYTTLTFGHSNSNYSTKVFANAIKRIAAYHALLIPLKGPKMLWQGGELGYDVSINTNGRTGNKPFNWNMLNTPSRLETFNQIALINRLKQHVSFSSDNYVYDVSGTGKFLKVSHDSMNTLIAGNFDIVDLTLNPGFQKTGWWYNYITGDSINVTAVGQAIPLAPGEYVIYTDRKYTYEEKAPLDPTGLEPLEANKIQVFPNPAERILFVTNSHYAAEKIRLINLQGQVVLETDNKEALNQVQMNVQGMSTGLYLVEVHTRGQVTTQKIVIR